MRPTFELQLPFPKVNVVQRVGIELKAPPWNSTSLVFDDYVELHIAPSELRYWSPHLTITFDGDEEKTFIRGRFAPRQEVWTLVWIVYLALAFTGFFAAVFAYSLWILDRVQRATIEAS